jgi:hypothetical protein
VTFELLALPLVAPPDEVLPELLALPLEDDCELLLVISSLLIQTIFVELLVLALIVLVEPGPVFVILPLAAAAAPVERQTSRPELARIRVILPITLPL